MMFLHSLVFRAHKVPGCWEWDSTFPTASDANRAVGMWRQKTQFGIFPLSVLVLTPVPRGCEGDAGDLMLGSSAMLLFPCTLLQADPLLLLLVCAALCWLNGWPMDKPLLLSVCAEAPWGVVCHCEPTCAPTAPLLSRLWAVPIPKLGPRARSCLSISCSGASPKFSPVILELGLLMGWHSKRKCDAHCLDCQWPCNDACVVEMR